MIEGVGIVSAMTTVGSVMKVEMLRQMKADTMMTKLAVMKMMVVVLSRREIRSRWIGGAPKVQPIRLGRRRKRRRCR